MHVDILCIYCKYVCIFRTYTSLLQDNFYCRRSVIKSIKYIPHSVLSEPMCTIINDFFLKPFNHESFNTFVSTTRK